MQPAAMHILCLGLNHHTAPVELRERLTFSPTALKAALARWGCGDGARPAGTAEGAILSTCNRLEVYAVAHDVEAADGLRAFLAEARRLSADLSLPFYTYVDEMAVQHLFRVAAGLDSMILGEPQILGQVLEAYEAARGQGAAGPVLAALFRRAAHAGKRARTETAISHSAATVSSVAVALAGQVFGSLSGCSVLVLGAGEMAELAARALIVRGAPPPTVVNRSFERARELAETWGGEALSFEWLGEALARADIVIAATAAPHVIVDVPRVEAALAARGDRPLFLIDIAVPRNVDAAVGRLPGVHLYNIDDLEALVEDHLNGRRREIPRVEEIVAEEVGEFMAWFKALDVVPIIAELRQRSEEVRQAEVARALRRLGDVSERERQIIEMMSQSLVNKLLHAPTERLKVEAGNGQAVLYAEVARALFNLAGKEEAHG
jgi:glutamyl-tRNA reductase